MANKPTLISQDRYGDWRCVCCGLFISDPRAVNRMEIRGYRSPVCPVCMALIDLVDPNRSHTHQYRVERVLEISKAQEFVKEQIRQGLPVDYTGTMDFGQGTLRVYVTRQGRWVLRLRRG